MKAMFYEVNPIPVKTALSLMGLCESEMRLPLCEASPDTLKKLRKNLLEYEILT
jgi:4-hydroxy-tetrahydrodipicolinate synthase